MRSILLLLLLIAPSAHAGAPTTSVLSVGARVGADVGGPLGETAGVAELEVGVALVERLSLVLGAGVAWCDRETYLLPLAARDGFGPGYVMVDDGLAPRLAVEVRYRQSLAEGALPVALDIATGLVVSRELRSAVSPAFFSGDPTCDPREAACALLMDTADVERDATVGWRFGLDVRIKTVLVGYRFHLGLGDAFGTHELFLGLVWP